MAIQDSPKERALKLLNQALDTGIKGRNRQAVQQAIEVLEDKGRDLTDMAYQHMKVGTELVDPNRPGFMMRANKANNRWIYRYSWHGKQKEFHLGDYPATSVADARGLWSDARAIRLKGESPHEHYQGQRDSASNVMTFGQMEKRYLELAEKNKRSWRDDMGLLSRRIPKEWKGRPANSITKYDIGGVIQAAGVSMRCPTKQSPREAEKLRALLNSMFNLAMARGRRMRSWLASDSPVVEAWIDTPANPVEGTILANREASTFRPETRHIRSFVSNLPTVIKHTDIHETLLLQLLTNTRVSEVCYAPWSEFDLDTGEWNIPAERVKNGSAHKVMLSRQAIELLTRQATKHGTEGMVFKAVGGGVLNSDSVINAVSRNRDALGVPAGFVSHSLRHYGQTWLASSKCPVEVRDRVSNHKPPGTMSSHYNAHTYDQEAAEWLQNLGDHVQALVTGNVVVLAEVR
jgi:integrase